MHLASPFLRLLARLVLVVSFAASLVASAWEVIHFDIYTKAIDFGYFRAYALVVSSHGWQAYYAPAYVTQSLPLNINPPLLALWLFPFLPFSPQVGFAIWTFLSLLALALAWWLTGNRKPWQLPLLALFFPVVYNLLLGQPVLFIALIVVIAWWLSEHDRALLGGAVLSLATIKPQLIFLVPLVLLLAGRWRFFAGFAVASVALLALSVALVGTAGVTQMIANQHYVLLHAKDNWLIPSTVLTLLLPGLPGLILDALLSCFIVVLAWRARHAPLSVLFALGLLSSLLLAPYLHPQDLALWAIAALLIARSIAIPPLLLALGVFATWSWIILSGILFAPLVPHLAWVPLVPLVSFLGILLIARSLFAAPSPSHLGAVAQAP